MNFISTLISLTVLVVSIGATIQTTKNPSASCVETNGFEPYPNDCSLYYQCKNNIKYLITCVPNNWFDPSQNKCININQATLPLIQQCIVTLSPFTSTKTSTRKSTAKQMQPTSSTSTKKVTTANTNHIRKEVKVEWNYKDIKTIKTKNGKHTKLPDHIVLNIPIDNVTIVTLNLKKRSYFLNGTKVITNQKGRISHWNTTNDPHYKVYVDPTRRASITVTNDKTRKRPTKYAGSFYYGQTKYNIESDVGPGKRNRPMKIKNNIQSLAINGSNYIVSQDAINVPDNRKVLAAQGITINKPTSLQTTLQNKLIAAQSLGPSSGKLNLGVELLVVIDYSIFYKWYMQSSATTYNAKKADAIQNIQYMYTNIVNGMDMRYGTINQTDMAFYVRIAGFFIATTPADANFTEFSALKLSSNSIDVYGSLTSFMAWIASQVNSSPRLLPTFDSAALFTNYDMTVVSSSGNYLITGLAYIGATCTSYAVSINRDYGEYATIETAAHELGHNLGALHDGEGNTCSFNDQFIMASAPGGLTNATFKNPYYFSSCSISYFRNYINSFSTSSNNIANCLLNPAVNADPNATANFLQVYPGQKYNLTTQCILLFGPSSFYCAGGGERDSLLCSQLYCYNPKYSTCTTMVQQRALDGTSCGNRSWCYMSECVANSKAPLITNAQVRCMYGDYLTSFNYGSGQINCQYMIVYLPWLCYESYYSDICCATCAAKKKANAIGCEFGDRSTSCPNFRTSWCYDSYNQTQCCQTCSNRVLNLPLSNCMYGDHADWCKSSIPLLTAHCYSSNATCCQTCLIYYTGVTGCEYGDKVTGCTSQYCSSASFLDLCCKTCQTYLSTPTPATTTTTKLTSVSTLLFTTIKKITSAISTSTTSITTKISLPTSFTTTSFPSSTVIPTCPNGDQAYWCPTIGPYHCYSANATCCKTCPQYYNPSMTGCEYGDKASWCSTYVTSVTSCQSTDVANLCCVSCAKYLNVPNTIPILCPNGDQASYCSTMGSWDCYNYKDICCSTCLPYYNISNTNCEYGDKVPWCKSYVQSPFDCLAPGVAGYCCKTCQAKQNQITVPQCTDSATWCSGMFAGHCYDNQTQSTCCATCQSYAADRTGSCMYGDWYGWCALQYCSMNAVQCCTTCK